MMKLQHLIVFLLATSLLAFPSVGHAYNYEVYADETLEEVERIVEVRDERFLAKTTTNNSISFPKAFSVWKRDHSFQEEKPYIVSRKFLVLRVLRL